MFAAGFAPGRSRARERRELFSRLVEDECESRDDLRRAFREDVGSRGAPASESEGVEEVDDERSEAVVGDAVHRHRLAVVEGSEESAEVGANVGELGEDVPRRLRRGAAARELVALEMTTAGARAPEDEEEDASESEPESDPELESEREREEARRDDLDALRDLASFRFFLSLRRPSSFLLPFLRSFLRSFDFFLDALPPRLGLGSRDDLLERRASASCSRSASRWCSRYTIQLSHVAQRRAELRVVRRHADPRTLE